MNINIKSDERDAIFVHIFFVSICLIVLLFPIKLPIGIKLFTLVIIYNTIIPIVGIWRNYIEWIKIWLFSLILSVFQIFPDWILSAQLNVLVFPEDGLFKIGTVSGYMLFLWIIPFFIIIFTGEHIYKRSSEKITYIFVIFLSFLIFGVSEMTIWTIGSWYAQNVFMILNIAIYIIIPEIILGVTTFWSYTKTKESKIIEKISVAFLIMLIYLGSAVFFYFLIEKVILLH